MLPEEEINEGRKLETGDIKNCQMPIDVFSEMRQEAIFLLLNSCPNLVTHSSISLGCRAIFYLFPHFICCSGARSLIDVSKRCSFPLLEIFVSSHLIRHKSRGALEGAITFELFVISQANASHTATNLHLNNLPRRMLC